MPFISPWTISDTLKGISRNEYLLPAIQREFVWSKNQIAVLFDSLMRDYPIGSFLFWEVNRENINEYQFYEFVKNYHQKDGIHNPKANVSGETNITSVLDGQQRLTALYIGLRGTYAEKIKGQRRDNPTSYPKTKLFLNVMSYSNEEDLEYEFKFLKDDIAGKDKSEKSLWFEIGKILDYKGTDELYDYLIEQEVETKYGKEKAKIANKMLHKLYQVIHNDSVINFFLEKAQDLDKVLNIFIRTNSGGTQLSYSDLLLSTATAQWKSKDAREEITSFVDEINDIGDELFIDKNMVLKSCLVLSGVKDVAFKVRNFNLKNMQNIEKLWDSIQCSIKLSVELVASFGFSGTTLTSHNALISIAGYLSNLDNPPNFIDADKYSHDRDKIRLWLLMVLLKRTFTGPSDNVIRKIRDVINKSNFDSGFPIDKIIEGFKGTNKAISFDEDSIQNILEYTYKEGYTYSALALIYPSLDFRNKFHKDHIFPQSFFTKTTLKDKGIPEDKIDFYMHNANKLANLQLLGGISNKEKSSADFKEWLEKTYPNGDERNRYMKDNYIPANIDLSFNNFEQFVEEREKLIVAKYKKLLNYKPNQ